MGAPTYLLSNECVRVDSAAGRLAVVAVRPPPDVHAERAVTFSTRSYRIRYREILGLFLYNHKTTTINKTNNHKTTETTTRHSEA